MATTIQVTQVTKQLLDLLKKKENAPSYDAIIQEMAREKVGAPKSMFGSIKGWSWSKKDRMEFHER